MSDLFGVLFLFLIDQETVEDATEEAAASPPNPAPMITIFFIDRLTSQFLAATGFKPLSSRNATRWRHVRLDHVFDAPVLQHRAS